MKSRSTARRIFTVFLFLLIAITAWLMMHQALQVAPGSTHRDIVFNPGYQHCQRLKVATARAAVDVLGMTAIPAADTDPSAGGYRADYRLQRMQIQADAEGLDRWAAGDTFRQGLLLEIRTSLANFRIALDQRSGDATSPAEGPRIPLLVALNRVQSALSNYSASLTEPANLRTPRLLFAGPVLLWWLLILLLVELAALAWVVFSASSII